MTAAKNTQKLCLGVVAVTATALLTGCPSMPMMTTAKTIGDGKNQVTISPGVVGFSSKAFGSTGDSSSEVGATVVVPDLMLAYRRGIGSSFDLGVGLSGFGKLSVDGKINFLGNDKDDKIALAVDPTVGGFFVAAGEIGGGYVDYSLPLLFDLAPSDWFRATIAPRYRGTVFLGSGGGETASSALHYVGSGLAAEFTVSDVLALQPHAAFDLLMNPPKEKSPDGTEVSASAIALTGGFAFKLNF